MTTIPSPEKKKWSAAMVGALLLVVVIGILIVMIATGAVSPFLQQKPTPHEVTAVIPAAISPQTGTAGTLVPVTLEGQNFAYGISPQVWLAKPGEPDIPAIDVEVISATQLTCTFPLTGSSVSRGQYEVLTKNAGDESATRIGVFTVLDEVPPTLMWDWSNAGGWDGWQYRSSCPQISGTTGSCREYGPAIVNGHGEYGTNVTFDRIPTESYVEKTFTAPSGSRWRNLTFTGQLSSTTVPRARWMTIDVNGVQVFSANATQTPPGNARQFSITTSFSPANTVLVRITNGQDLTWGTTMYTMQFNSLTLS